jgi:MFS family permease
VTITTPTYSAHPSPPPPPRVRLGRPFWLVWLATAFSSIGDGVALVAFPLLATQLTDDPLLIVGVLVAERLPALLFSLPAGAVADRVDRKRLLQATDLLRMGVLGLFGVLVVTDRATIGVLLITVFVLGTAQTFFVAASYSVLPLLLRPFQLTRGNGLIYSAESTCAQMLGPAIGGLLFAAAAMLPFLLDSGSFAISALLLTVALPIVRRHPRPGPAVSLLSEMREGIAHFAARRELRWLAAMIAGLAFFQAMVFAPLVLFALRELGLSELAFGVMLSCAAVGDVLGGLTAERADRTFGPERVLPIAGAVAAFGYLVVGVAGNVVVATVALAFESAAVAWGNVSSLALRQRIIPAALLGRVGTVFRFFIYGAVPVGALVGGLLSDVVSLRAPFLAAAAAQALAVVLIGPRLIAALQSSGSAKVSRRGRRAPR